MFRLRDASIHARDLIPSRGIARVLILLMIGFVVNVHFRTMTGVKIAKNANRSVLYEILFRGLKTGNAQSVVILIMLVAWNAIAANVLNLKMIDSYTTYPNFNLNDFCYVQKYIEFVNLF